MYAVCSGRDKTCTRAHLLGVLVFWSLTPIPTTRSGQRMVDLSILGPDPEGRRDSVTPAPPSVDASLLVQAYIASVRGANLPHPDLDS